MVRTEATLLPEPTSLDVHPPFDLLQIVLDLRVLAATLVSRWSEMDEGGRLAALTEIGRRARLLEKTWAGMPDEGLTESVAMLTRRELEVLQALADVGSNAKAAAKLFVSVSTVRSHVKSILKKLEVHSRTEAVALALRHNLIPRRQTPSQ